MIAHFEAHKSDFEALARSVSTVDVRYISLREDNPSGYLSEQKMKQVSKIKEELRQLDLYSTYHDPDSDYGISLGIEFSVSGNDSLLTMFEPGWGLAGKGYAHLNEPPKRTVDSLNKIDDEFENYRYRHIEGNWYIYGYRVEDW